MSLRHIQKNIHPVGSGCSVVSGYCSLGVMKDMRTLRTWLHGDDNQVNQLVAGQYEY